MRRFNFNLGKIYYVMRKLISILAISLLFSSVIAHSGHGEVENHSQPSDVNQQVEDQSGFSQLYPGYRSGTLWVIAEVVIVLGATGIAIRHYYRKSESSSLKEFIREEVL